MKKASFGIALTAFPLIMAGCLSLNTNTLPITIGAVFNLTGSQQALDIPAAQGARAAVAEINKAGGLLGRRVALLVVDGESQPRTVAAKTDRMLADHPAMPGVIGLSDTDMVLAAAPVAAGHQRVFLTSGATSPLLPDQVPDYLFLACFGDNVQAAVGAEWAFTQLRARNAVIIYNENATYTRLLQQYFRTRFEQLGGHIVRVLPYAPDALDALTIRPEMMDLVYLAATPEEVLPVLARLHRAGISAPVLGGDGLDIGSAWQAGRQFKDVFFTTHAYLGADNSDPHITAFRKSFGELFPDIEPDAFSALGFDTVFLLAAAITKAGSIQPAAVRQSLTGLQGFQGITGTVSYGSGSRIPTKSVAVIHVDRGKQSLVGTFTPAAVPKP